jgi:hypothetical protein
VEEVKVHHHPCFCSATGKTMFLEMVIDTGITYYKSGIADPNPGSGVSLTQSQQKSKIRIQDEYPR